ncbi:MAG: hypothetical protein KF753_08620 [Caldilineaceae bacterium]|nr:hypothetical protein [Caldilineaceae bacterium]
MPVIRRVVVFVVEEKHKILWECLLAVWLWGIILNQLLAPGFYGVAVYGLGLALGILALARRRNRIQSSVLIPACAVAKRR